MRNSGTTWFAVIVAILLIVLAAPALAQPARGGGMGPGGMAGGPTDNPSTSMGSSDMGASTDERLAATDRSFMMKAAKGGLEEVELGKLAASKASNPDVKSFGQRMVDDHSKANDKLKKIASDKGVPLPTDLDRKAKADRDRLDKLSGADFDRAYVEMMVKDHVTDVADFDRESKRAHDSELRQFVSDTLPTLQDHLKMAKDLQPKVGASGSASRGSQPR
jgi:putative membrane protein